jgi:hypothetical protein
MEQIWLLGTVAHLLRVEERGLQRLLLHLSTHVCLGTSTHGSRQPSCGEVSPDL